MPRTVSADVLRRVARTMAASSAAREAIPPDHAESVAERAVAIARYLGLADDDVLICQLGGLLHDIGKVVVPEELLRRPGPIKPSEREVIERHAAVGAEIVALVPAIAAVAPAVRHHHERFDGRGYPDGLAGDDIPLVARVIAAADAAQAMSEDRPYRSGLPADAIAAELAREAGGHFDPDIAFAAAATLVSSAA